MSNQTRKRQRHHELEKEIAEALKHNSIDDLKIVELKRQKLQLKDEIERLQHGGADDSNSKAS